MKDRRDAGEQVPLLDEIVEPEAGAERPPPNLDLFGGTGPDRRALQAALAGRLNAWLARALPEALREIEDELLQRLEQRLMTELPALVAEALEETHRN